MARKKNSFGLSPDVQKKLPMIAGGVVVVLVILFFMFMNKKKSYVTIIHLENHRYLP
jgi:flagellar biosynthesis/type III secretory pathway M-ring protein FliF/YscJ